MGRTPLTNFDFTKDVNRIIRAMDARLLTIADLARLSKMSPQRVGLFLHGKGGGLGTLKRLLYALRLPINPVKRVRK